MLIFVVLILAGSSSSGRKACWIGRTTRTAPGDSDDRSLNLTPVELSAGGTGAQMIPEDLRDNPLAMAFDDLATTAKFEFGELTIEVAPANILEALRLAKDDA